MTETSSSGASLLQLDSADGVIVAAYRWDPAGEPRAVARITHGMGEHALRYTALAAALNERGYVVYAQDHRGHGATAPGPEALGRIGADGWIQLVEDIGRLGDRAGLEHPDLPQVILGHSMGSFAVQQYLLSHSADVAAAVLTGTAVIDLLEPALDLDAPMDLSMFNAAFEPARTEFDWLSRDEAEVDKYVADPLCGFGIDADSTRQMFVSARAMADPDALALIRRDLPVLVSVGDADPVGGELALVHALVDRYTSAGLSDVTLQVHPGARHEVYHETNADEVVTDVLDWLDARLEPLEPRTFRRA